MEIYSRAIELATAGLAIIPICPHSPQKGDKRPAIPWKRIQTQHLTNKEIEKWFETGNYGIAIAMGTTSNGLLMIELEGKAAHHLPELTQLAADSGLGTLWQKMCGWWETSPTGGHHWYIYCPENQHGNRKLACTTSGKVLAETRENGGYSVVAPLNGKHYHHTGEGAWELITGGPNTAGHFTLSELDDLLNIFRTIDQHQTGKETHKKPPQPTLPVNNTYSSITPGDDYEQKTSWNQILEPYGWQPIHKTDTITYWRRPGKQAGISATTGHATDRDRLYVFTTSTIFTPETPYTKFAAYTLLNHDGNYKEAAKQLASEGYGQQPEHPRDPLYLEATQFQGNPPNTTTIEPLTYTRTDDGNALRFADTYTGMLRYIPEKDTWTVWNRHVWDTTDGTAAAIQKGRQLARNLPENDKTDKAHKKRSCNAGSIKNMLYLARHAENIYTPLTSFDANPYQLNTPKGTINLKTGKLTPPDPNTLCLHVTNIAPNPNQPTPLWLNFLAQTFTGTPELTTYIQRFLGMTLIGQVREQLFAFMQGQGANGKSTMLNVIQKILGTMPTGYTTSIPPNIFLKGAENRHPTEIASLHGVRLAITSETEEGQKFAEAKLKLLTGSDTITARFMHQDFFTFTPSHTIIMVSNHEPEVLCGGDAFWRRIRKIPFNNIVPEPARDPELETKLLTEAPGILAWLIQGCMDYLRDGLQEPDVVKVATREYRTSQNTVAQFLKEACQVHETNKNLFNIRIAEFRSRYEQWCRINGLDPVGPKSLGQQLKRAGVESGTSGGYRYYSGISIKPEYLESLNGEVL